MESVMTSEEEYGEGQYGLRPPEYCTTVVFFATAEMLDSPNSMLNCTRTGSSKATRADFTVMFRTSSCHDVAAPPPPPPPPPPAVPVPSAEEEEEEEEDDENAASHPLSTRGAVDPEEEEEEEDSERAVVVDPRATRLVFTLMTCAGFLFTKVSMIESILSMAASGKEAPRTSSTVEMVAMTLPVVSVSNVPSIAFARFAIFNSTRAISDPPLGPLSWEGFATADDRAPTIAPRTSCFSCWLAPARSLLVPVAPPFPDDKTSSPISLIISVRFLVASAVVRVPLFLLRSFAAACAAPVSFLSTAAFCDGSAVVDGDGDGDGENPAPATPAAAFFDGDGELAVTVEMHEASSATAVPDWSFWSRPQDVTVLSRHALSSVVLLNVPGAQAVHVESSAAFDPST